MSKDWGIKRREQGEEVERLAIEVLEEEGIEAFKGMGTWGNGDLYSVIKGVPTHIEVKKMSCWYKSKGVKRLNHLKISEFQLSEMQRKNKEGQYAFFLIMLLFKQLKNYFYKPLVLFPSEIPFGLKKTTKDGKGAKYYSLGFSEVIGNSFPLKYIFKILEPKVFKQTTLFSEEVQKARRKARQEDKTDFEDEWETIEKNELAEEEAQGDL
jgi:hypothetical protein